VGGVFAVVVIIIAGWQYVTSGGEAAKIQGAKNALIYAVVGLVVIASASIIIRIVLSSI
jgi:hypothetical protein